MSAYAHLRIRMQQMRSDNRSASENERQAVEKTCGVRRQPNEVDFGGGFPIQGTGWYVTDYACKESKTDSKETKETKESKETSSNGNKEGNSGSKAGAEKAGKKDSASKSGGKKE